MKPLLRKEAFEIGNTNELSTLRTVEEISVLDGNISIESNPSEVALFQCLTHNYLCISANGLVQLNIDGVLENFPSEFKIISSYDSWEPYLQTANDIGKFNRCLKSVGNI